MAATEQPIHPDEILGDPQTSLEKNFIKEYLSTKGYKAKDLIKLPEELARQLRIEASIYASNKLAEVETRSRLVHEIHGEF